MYEKEGDSSLVAPRCRDSLLLQQDNSPNYIFQRRYRSFVSRERRIRFKERFKADGADEAGSELGKIASVGRLLSAEAALQRRLECGGGGPHSVRQAVRRLNPQRSLGVGSHVPACTFGSGSSWVGGTDSRFPELASGRLRRITPILVREERARPGGPRQQVHARRGVDLRKCFLPASPQRGVGNVASIAATMATDPAEVVSSRS